MLLLLLLLPLFGLAAPPPSEDMRSEFVCIDQMCYSIYWESKRFGTARNLCEAKSGRLMTVRNSVQADAILLFMAKVSRDPARVWIGLEQPYGNRCTDEFQPLRGFSWVTGDLYTDYANWKSSGEKKCGALCVTVDKNGLWEETDCNVKPDGFLCELDYQLSCSPLNLNSEVNVIYYHNTLGLGRSGGPFLPPGTNARISSFQHSLLCESKSDGPMAWSSQTPGAWPCEIENGGCEHECTEVSGVPECRCPSESQLKADNRTCTKPCDPNPCNQFCSAMLDPPFFACVCEEGYYLADDGKTCIDIDDCANPGICEDHCTNTIGSFICGCKPGYEPMEQDCDGPDLCPLVCQDIDECNSPITFCEHDCRNSPGNYSCVCYEGFVVDEKNPNRCKRFCNTSFCEAECDVHSQDSCRCPDGYVVDEDDEGKPICSDIDECEINVCDGTCINLFGSYQCTCPEGFLAYEEKCIPLDDGSGTTETLPVTPTLESSPTKSPAPDIHSLQPAMLLGICIGIISMLTVLLAILCHMLRKHYKEEHALDYKIKNQEKGVVLQQVKTDPPRKL